MGERLLVIMGSGETTPTMVTTHQQVLDRVGPEPDAVLVDTPYGFQENADDITARAVRYFADHVGESVRPVRLPDVRELSPARLEDAIVSIEQADWLFAGPGSPSYLLSQWGATRLPDALRERVSASRGATVFASAAAVTLGSDAIPVYEIYKAGEDPHWLPGLEIMQQIGLDCVVIPHFDNAEGGTHDTRYCYLGERRLSILESELPEGRFVLGVDEHTAAVIDLDAGTLRVAGRGGVTVRRGGAHRRFPAGETVGLGDLRPGPPRPSADGRAAEAEPVPAPAASATPLLDIVSQLQARFDRALEDDAALDAADAALELEAAIRGWAGDTQESDEMDRAVESLRSMIVRLGRLAQAGLHDHREVVAPHVESLIDLRADARERGEYAVADRIRDDLEAAGVEVHDTPDGTDWDYAEAGPADGGRA